MRQGFIVPQVNWDRRVGVLARCEGVVAGGATAFGSFTDLFRALLRDLISLQIADRCHRPPERSAYPSSAFVHLAVLRCCEKRSRLRGCVLFRKRRRSAVSRQACHLVAVLAEALGHSFGGLALHFVQDLLKMVVITIQASTRSILHPVCCSAEQSHELQELQPPVHGAL